MLNIVLISEEYYEENSDFTKISLKTYFIEVFLKNYPILSRLEDDFLKEWTKICRIKANPRATNRDKQIYLNMTARDSNLVNNAIFEIHAKIAKL